MTVSKECLLKSLEGLKGEQLTYSKLKQLERKCDNPGRPTAEFWSATYPKVLTSYRKKYPPAEATKRARAVTGSIWQKMSSKKKAKYETIRIKREGSSR